MSSMNNSVNQLLRKMRETGGTAKGVVGEDAVFTICEKLYQAGGGILYHSYEYKVDKDKEGNIKRHANGDFYLENLGSTTEIDVLLITPFRIFPLEVKAYKAKEIVVTDEGISGCFKTDKSPVHQHEMHCRHLYPSIYRVLPKGMTEYIVPIVVFVDEVGCIKDAREDWQKKYIRLANLNGLATLIKQLNEPLQFRLDLPAIARVLNECCVTSKKHLPLRQVE